LIGPDTGTTLSGIQTGKKDQRTGGGTKILGDVHKNKIQKIMRGGITKKKGKK